MELVAEGDDSLMEEFFDKGTIAEEHIVGGLHNAIREDKIFPVLFASGLGNIGTDEVLDFIVDYMPTAVERGSRRKLLRRPTMASPPSRKVSDSEPLSLYVFKTISDPILRPHLVLQGLLRRVEERRVTAELQPRQLGEIRPHLGHAGQNRRYRSTNCMPAISAPWPS